MLFATIVACEIAFWVLLAVALIARYGLRRRRLSSGLLLALPAVDLALLVVTAIDLQRGATATPAHGLAAVYIGFSIAFGSTIVRWADQRVAHRFAGGPPPWKPPKRGPQRARYEWREFGKGVLGAAVSAALLAAAIGYVGAPERTAALDGWFVRLGVILVVWFVAFPLWFTLTAAFAPAPGRTRPDDSDDPNDPGPQTLDRTRTR